MTKPDDPSRARRPGSVGGAGVVGARQASAPDSEQSSGKAGQRARRNRRPPGAVSAAVSAARHDTPPGPPPVEPVPHGFAARLLEHLGLRRDGRHEDEARQAIERRRRRRRRSGIVTVNEGVDRLAPQEKAPSEFVVGTILDEFSHNSFRDEFRAVPLEPRNWRARMEASRPDVLLCESAWSGRDSRRRPWKGKVYASDRFRGENRKDLIELIDYCRREGIPTVFWNKEDPVNYADRRHDFVKTALLFDNIFTTAAECVPRYRADHGAERVFELTFATNPRMFNPIEFAPRRRKVTFAGSWYDNYEERSRQTRTILDDLARRGFEVEIYDRYYGDDDPLHKWPVEYAPLIRPPVAHDAVADVYKSGLFSLNINTVLDSTTMFARRVYEIMSCNSLVLSNYSLGLERRFGDLVFFTDRDMDRLASLSESEIEDIRLRALELVLAEHTYRHRWREILTAIGMPHRAEDERITIACPIRDAGDARAAIDFCMQKGLNPPDYRLLLVVADTVPAIEVDPLYAAFNRFSTTVVSADHLRRYPSRTPVDTTFFYYVDPARHDVSRDWLARARLHSQYLSEHLITPATTEKPFRFSPWRDGVPYFGHRSLFPDLIRRPSAGASLYHL